MYYLHGNAFSLKGRGRIKLNTVHLMRARGTSITSCRLCEHHKAVMGSQDRRASVTAVEVVTAPTRYARVAEQDLSPLHPAL